MSTLDFASFLSRTPPFDSLSPAKREDIASKIDIAYYKNHQMIAEAEQEATSFFIVAKGIIEEIGEDGFPHYHLEKDSFDYSSVVSGRYSNLFRCIEESILYEIKKADFLKIVHENIEVETYFLQNTVNKLKGKNKGAESYLLKKISDIKYQSPIFVDEDITIYETVAAMSAAKKTFSLINFNNGSLGIVTDSDFRKRVILTKLSYECPIGTIATQNPITIKEDDFLFNAMLVMAKHGIKRLVVKRDEKIVGVVEEINILASMANDTSFISKKIDAAKSAEELKEAAEEIIPAVEYLLAEGVKARHICKLVGELNAKIFAKVYELFAPEELIQNSCFIVMGSEGRGEQILRTDQDNAIILRDGFEFGALAEVCEKITETLIYLGYPECDGKVMVNNPYYAKSLKAFKESVYDDINSPSGDGFMRIAILLDLKAAAGDFALSEQLREFIHEHIRGGQFLSYFAKAALMFETPLGLFNTFLLSRSEHKNELDIKKGAIFPIVHAVRSLAAEYAVSSPNTFERIKELNNAGIINREFAEELIEGYDFLLEIRLKERLSKIKMGIAPDNYINPSRLGKLERDLLKDVLKIVERLKKFIFAHFKLGYAA